MPLLEGNTALRALNVSLAGAITLAVAMGIGRFAFTPLLPMMQSDGFVSLAAGSWLASINYVGYLAGALCAPLLRLRVTLIIRGALAAVVLLTLAMGMVEQFSLWLLLRFGAGVCSAWLLIFTSGWCLEKLVTLGKPALGGVLFSGTGLGIALAGAACLALMMMGVDSRSAWLALGAMGLLLTAAVWPAFKGPAAVPSRSSSGWQRLDSSQWRIVLGNGANGFGYIVPATFLPSMARELVSDPATFGLAWPVFGAAAMLSTLLAGIALGHFSNRRIWAGSHFIMALGAALPVFFPGLAAILFAALAVGGTFMVATMCAIREARVMGGANTTGLTAAAVAAFALGQIIGPLCVAALAALPDGPNPYSPALLLAALALVVSGGDLLRRA